MADLNAQIRRLFEKGITDGDLTVIDEVIGDDYKNHDMPAPAPGREGLKQIVKAWRAAFPDIKMTLHEVIVAGDKVATRGSFTGTHKGEFNGIPATGKRVDVPWMDMWRAQNGKFVENWVRIDMLGMLTQLGVIPAQGKK